jgi:hypothetical protein
MVSHFEPSAPPSPNPVGDPKRKKTVVGEVQDNNDALAGPFEGDRQAQ